MLCGRPAPGRLTRAPSAPGFSYPYPCVTLRHVARKTRHLTVRISAPMYARLHRLAQQERRTVSGLVVYMLDQGLRKLPYREDELLDLLADGTQNVPQGRT